MADKRGKKPKKSSTVISHLKGDIQGFKKEIKEDKELIKKIKDSSIWKKRLR